MSVDLTAEQKGRCQTDLWVKNVNKRKVSVRALMCVQCCALSGSDSLLP